MSITGITPRPVHESKESHDAHQADEGQLIGWLVSYDEQGKGSAREIRSGRFFVTGSQLRENDMIVPHHSISTPHCLAHASAEEGIKVLDLMSKRGTSVRRRGTNNFVPHGEIVNVSHGDWLRLGQYDVLVCLVPTAGRS